MKKRTPILSIVGPTASGKTRLSIELSKIFNGEIINADSMQIYKHMDIGTAKPTKEEMEQVRHHLIGILNINQEFSVSDYLELARNKINDIYDRHKLPILVGGTGLYVNTLINNVDMNIIPQDLKIRKRLAEEIKMHGGEYFLNILRRVDPKMASKLHYNDVGRIVRALEVFEITGKPITELHEDTLKKESAYKVCMIGLNYRNRDLLYEKINLRVEKMFEMGLLKEVENLRSENIGKTAYQAIGYKELEKFFNGDADLLDVMEEIKQKTRKYAKRQITWFRKEKKINWLYLDDYQKFQEILQEAKKIVEEFDLM